MRTAWALMVMPRSRSRSMESSTWACISRAVSDAGQLQQAVGQRGFAVVDVRDDGEIAEESGVHGYGGQYVILTGRQCSRRSLVVGRSQLVDASERVLCAHAARLK